jgi:hypothetical protein
METVTKDQLQNIIKQVRDKAQDLMNEDRGKYTYPEQAVDDAIEICKCWPDSYTEQIREAVYGFCS